MKYREYLSLPHLTQRVMQYDDPRLFHVPLSGFNSRASAKISKHYGVLAGISFLANIDEKVPLVPAFVMQLSTFSHPAVIDRR